MNPEIVKYDLTLKELPVEIGGQQYTLKELDGVMRDAYLTDMASRMGQDKQGRPTGLKNFNGLQAALLGRCLYNSEDKLVDKNTINRWPASVVAGLFEQAQELSALGKEPGEEEAAAKND